jgi:hypothetical protein
MAPLGDGRMTDLSKVAPSGFAVIPFFAEYINSPGEIVGSAIERDPRQLPRLQTNPMRRRWQIAARDGGSICQEFMLRPLATWFAKLWNKETEAGMHEWSARVAEQNAKASRVENGRPRPSGAQPSRPGSD